MNVIICLDDSRGMLFNKRRQSRDKAVTERIEQLCAGHKLWMNSYSAGLYGAMDDAAVSVDDGFLGKAGKGEFCLVESDHLKNVEKDIEKLIVFWWNRKYPGDFHLDLNLEEWTQISAEEFAGSSHEKITEIIYTKK